MEFEWDPAKRLANLAKHGLDFEDVADLPWDTMTIVHDGRRDYGERRSQAYGLWKERLYVVALTVRGDRIRIISFRKANDREAKRYGS